MAVCYLFNKRRLVRVRTGSTVRTSDAGWDPRLVCYWLVKEDLEDLPSSKKSRAREGRVSVSILLARQPGTGESGRGVWHLQRYL